MLSPELENQGRKSCREDSDKSLNLLMTAQVMKKRSQAGGQGSFLVSSAFCISSGQESVQRSRSGRAVVQRQRASRAACWTVTRGMAEENEELPCPRPVVSMVVQGFGESPFPRSHQGHSLVNASKVEPFEVIKKGFLKFCSAVLTEQGVAATIIHS